MKQNLTKAVFIAVISLLFVIGCQAGQNVAPETNLQLQGVGSPPPEVYQPTAPGVTPAYVGGSGMTVAAASGGVGLCNNTLCGEPFRRWGWWPAGSDYSFEIQDLRGFDEGFKVKVLFWDGFEINHVDCQSFLDHPDQGFEWMTKAGFEFDINPNHPYNGGRVIFVPERYFQ